MAAYVDSALFIYTESTKLLSNELENNLFGTRIVSVALDQSMLSPQGFLVNVGHVVVAGSLADIKMILNLAITYDFSVGLIPSINQKNLIKFFDLLYENNSAIELAL